MKKIIASMVFLIAIVCAGTWQVNKWDTDVALSDLAISNVEALAYLKPIKPGFGNVDRSIDPCFGCTGGYVCTGEGIISCP